MAAKALLPCTVVLSFHLLFFSLVSSNNVPLILSAGTSQFPPLTCPKDALKLGICANLLNKLLNLVIGDPPKDPCCSLVQGLVDVGAGVCLCTAIKANILGINLNVPIALSLLVNYCDKNVPARFQCP